MNLRVTIPSEMMFSWRSQAQQYPIGGEPGISYFAGDTSGVCTCEFAACHVDCLLFRSWNGSLLGILNHYNHHNVWEIEGNVNLWVNPAHRRQGVGRALLTESMWRWPFDPTQQRYTEAGLALVRSVLEI